MRKFGFLRVSAFSPIVSVGDVASNLSSIIDCIKSDEKHNSDILLFPELCLTGYTCADLFGQDSLHDQVWKALNELQNLTKNSYHSKKIIVVGAPIQNKNSLYNCAIVINDGRIAGIVPKQFLPNYKEFYEARWFKEPDGSEPKYIDSSIVKNRLSEIPFGTDLLFNNSDFDVSIGIEICEDIWVPIPPSSYQALAGANVLLNLSASNETVAKSVYRKNLVENQSGRCMAAYVYCSCGPTESTSDLVFGGHSIIAENGTTIKESAKFIRESQAIVADIDIQKLNQERRKSNSFGNSTKFLNKNFTNIKVLLSDNDYVSDYRKQNDLYREVSPTPFIPNNDKEIELRCQEIFSIQTCALAKRLEQLNKNSKINIGISGGLDSTLALLAAVKTCDSLNFSRNKIQGITMPGFGTTNKTQTNAELLMEQLGICHKTIDIGEMCMQAFRDIGHHPFGIDTGHWSAEEYKQLLVQNAQGKKDVTFENIQARIRTLILMSHGFVLGTGDLSELALGWCTYNGDHMSMYNINCSVPKTLVKFLVEYIASKEFDENSDISKTLKNIVDTKISPELLPPNSDGEIEQDTQNNIGPYALHDFFLAHFIRTGASPDKILFLAKHAFKNIYSEQKIQECLKIFYDRFFSMQFKRNCVPDGPKVGSVSLSPRGDWRMPSDAVQSFYRK